MMSDRPIYSQSVDIFRKKEKGKSIIHRKKYQFLDDKKKLWLLDLRKEYSRSYFSVIYISLIL